jgi:saccharopine dehydrogenase-like NADP-dependent oxidoreductase
MARFREINAMRNIMITGAGKIGSLIACLFADTGDYQVHLIDTDFSGADASRVLKAIPEIKTEKIDVKDQLAFQAYVTKHRITAIISSLPYFLNTHVACVAHNTKVHYFDLSEDTEVAKNIKSVALGANSAFVPQCGLAPGFVSIVANSLMQEFDQCHHARLRVGALPQNNNHALQYALTWSTDGLINEYGNLCYGIENGSTAVFRPLEGLESIQLDGSAYEAFNTSGGLGGLAEIYMGKVQSMDYKTIRYPGHCEKMRFLMNDLELNKDRDTLKRILENVIPKTYQDVVLIYVSVEGFKHGELIEESYFKKIYPQSIRGLHWSAIQVATASGVCAVVDLVLDKPKRFNGLVLQEQFHLKDVLANRFGKRID